MYQLCNIVNPIIVPLVYIYIFIDGYHNIVPLRCSWHHRTFGRSARGLSGVSGQVHPVSPPPPPVLQGNKVPSTHWNDLVRLQGDHWQGNAISRQDDIHVSSGTVSRHVAWDNTQRVASQGRHLRVRDVCHHSPIEILSNVCDRTARSWSILRCMYLWSIPHPPSETALARSLTTSVRAAAGVEITSSHI